MASVLPNLTRSASTNTPNLDVWRERATTLRKLIGKRAVHCEDLGQPKPMQIAHWRLHRDGEPTSLNQLLVRQGFALNFEPDAKGRFQGRRGEREGQA